MASLVPLPKFYATDNNGRPVPGGKLFTYLTGTNTKADTYTTASGGVANTNPVVMDSAGRANVWIDATKLYRFAFSPSTDTDPPTNAFWTVDGVGMDADGVRFILPLTNAVARTIGDKAADTASFFDFMTTAEKADVTARTKLVDVSAAVNRAIASVADNFGTLLMPVGDYRCDGPINIVDFPQVSILGMGPGASNFVSNSAADPFFNIGSSTMTPLELMSIYQGFSIVAGASTVTLMQAKMIARATWRDVWFEGLNSLTNNTQLVNDVDLLFERCRWRSATGAGVVISYDNTFVNNLPTTISFRKFVVTSCIGHGFTMSDAAGIVLDDGIIESCGTGANDTSHGAIYAQSMDPSGVGRGLSAEHVWIENCTGTGVVLADNSSGTRHTLWDINCISGTRMYGLYVPAPGMGRSSRVSVRDSAFQNATTQDILTGDGVSAQIRETIATSNSLGNTTSAWPVPSSLASSLVSAEYLGTGAAVALTGATPVLTQGRSFTLTQSGSTNVTAFSGGAIGEDVYIIAGDGNSTLTNSATLVCPAGADLPLTLNQCVTLLRKTATIYQVVGGVF